MLLSFDLTNDYQPATGIWMALTAEDIIVPKVKHKCLRTRSAKVQPAEIDLHVPGLLTTLDQPCGSKLRDHVTSKKHLLRT